MPSFAALNNPIDVTAGILDDPAMFREALRLIAADPNVDMIGLPLAAVGGAVGTTLAREVAALRKETDVPILVAWNAPEESAREAYAILAEAGVPRYRHPGAMRARLRRAVAVRPGAPALTEIGSEPTWRSSVRSSAPRSGVVRRIWPNSRRSACSPRTEFR